MNVSLGEKWEAFIAQCVESGRYLSASEVVRDAMRLLEEQECLRQHRAEELRKEIQIGLDALDNGDYVEIEDIDGLKAHLEGLYDEAVARVTEQRKAV
jgi:antitoxin ParD1/3/4